CTGSFRNYLKGGERMKALGIVRKIDDLGRVVIPKEVRISQGWEPGHSMEMFMSGNKLVLQSYESERKREDAINTLEQVIEKGAMEGVEEIELLKVINYLKGVK